jgi:hypothetical protein
MGWIEGTVLAALSAVGTTVSKLIGDDVKAWISHITERLIERATSKLPELHRERYAGGMAQPQRSAPRPHC